jgi:hypothetical protein
MKVPCIDVARWVDNIAPPLDPAAMQYRARPATGVDECSGCVFKGQRAKVCMAAGAAARLAGAPDCEERDVKTGRTFVYYEIETDPRQLRIDQESK